MAGQTLIVGAGPAGLAVASTLRRFGLEATVLERADSVAASWRGRYDGLRLHTMRRLSGLPGAPIPRRYGRWVARDDLVAYLEDYTRRFGIVTEVGVDVTRIEREAQGWGVDTSSGRRLATSVVVATGNACVPSVPDWPGAGTFTGPLDHSSVYREPSPYRDKRVLVVGAGNSAAEIAVEIAEVAAQVDVSVRTPPNIVRRATLGVPSQLVAVALNRLPEAVLNPTIGFMRKVTVPDLTRYGLPAPPGDGFSQFLRSQTVPILDHGFVGAIRDGRIRVVAPIESIDGDDVHTIDGRVLRPDAIVAATGYRPGVEPLVGDLGVLDDAGMPRVHGPDTLTIAPGLYFVGMTVELAGHLREIAHEARAVGQAIATAARVDE